MSLFKSILTICLQNFRKWKTDYRIWIIGISMLVMTWVYLDDILTITEKIDEAVPIWIYPFIYSQFYMKLIYTLPLILVFCNAPFIDDNQTFVYMRSGRKRWLCGQILYVTLASGIYYVFLVIVCLLSTVAVNGEISLEWGKTLSNIAASNIAGYLGVPFVESSMAVITYFTPLSAVWFTFLLSWLCGTMIGLLIFFCNTFVKTRFLGIAASAVMIVLSALVDTGFRKVLPFSPVSWITLDKVDVGGLTSNPSFGYCIGVYLGIIALLIAGIFIFSRKQSMDVKGN